MIDQWLIWADCHLGSFAANRRHPVDASARCNSQPENFRVNREFRDLKRRELRKMTAQIDTSAGCVNRVEIVMPPGRGDTWHKGGDRCRVRRVPDREESLRWGMKGRSVCLTQGDCFDAKGREGAYAGSDRLQKLTATVLVERQLCGFRGIEFSEKALRGAVLSYVSPCGRRSAGRACRFGWLRASRFLPTIWRIATLPSRAGP